MSFRDDKPAGLRRAGRRGRRGVVTALMLPFLASMILSLAAAPLPAPGEDVFLARSIEEYITKRSQALSHKVDSISINKTDGAIEEGMYRSTWEIVVRFRLSYVRPDEDPFLAGMVRCLSELKISSDGQWIKWAEEEIARRREEVRDRMAFAQESPERIAAYAEISSAGYIDAETIKLQVAGAAEALPVEILLQGVTDPAIFEAQGYQYLANARDAEGDAPASAQQPTSTPLPTQPSGEPHPPTSSPQTSVGASSGSSAASPSPTQALTPGEKSGETAKPATRPSTESGSRLLIFWSVGILALLLVVLVVSEIHNQKRK